MMEGRLTIPIKSKHQLDKIFEAEMRLSEAGVTFDTGSDIVDGKAVTRQWELDWSLSGAELQMVRDEASRLGVNGNILSKTFGGSNIGVEDTVLPTRDGAEKLLDQIIGRR